MYVPSCGCVWAFQIQSWATSQDRSRSMGSRYFPMTTSGALRLMQPWGSQAEREKDEVSIRGLIWVSRLCVAELRDLVFLQVHELHIQGPPRSPPCLTFWICWCRLLALVYVEKVLVSCVVACCLWIRAIGSVCFSDFFVCSSVCVCVCLSSVESLKWGSKGFGSLLACMDRTSVCVLQSVSVSVCMCACMHACIDIYIYIYIYVDWPSWQAADCGQLHHLSERNHVTTMSAALQAHAWQEIHCCLGCILETMISMSSQEVTDKVHVRLSFRAESQCGSRILTSYATRVLCISLARLCCCHDKHCEIIFVLDFVLQCPYGSWRQDGISGGTAELHEGLLACS